MGVGGWDWGGRPRRHALHDGHMTCGQFGQALLPRRTCRREGPSFGCGGGGSISTRSGAGSEVSEMFEGEMEEEGGVYITGHGHGIAGQDMAFPVRHVWHDAVVAAAVAAWC